MNRAFYTGLITFLVLSQFISKAQVIDTVCHGAKEKYSIVPREGSVYLWSVTGGTIVAERDSFIIVDWGNSNGIFEIKTIEINMNGCLGDPAIAQIMVMKDARMESDNPKGQLLKVNNNGTGRRGFVWQTVE